MLEEGQIEYVDVGVKAIRCIRLTKYNPDRVRRSTSTTVVPKVAVARLHDPQQLGQTFPPGFAYILIAQSSDIPKLLKCVTDARCSRALSIRLEKLLMHLIA